MLPSARMLSLPAAELTGLHVALHDVHAVLLVEGHAGDLVEADHVVLADQTALTGGVVHEHPCHGRLAARDQVRIGRDLLVQVAFARAAGAELDHVVVPLDERDHAEQEGVTLAFRQAVGLQTDAAQQDPPPACGIELAATGSKGCEHVALRELDLPQRGHAERAPVGLQRDGRVVLQLDLGIEAARQHPLVLLHQGGGNANIAQPEARQLDEVRVRLRVEAGRHEVDDPDRPLLSRPRLEQLLFAGPDSARRQLTLDDVQTLLDFGLIRCRAIAAEEEFDDVSRDRKLTTERSHQVLALPERPSRQSVVSLP
jgi:hypothetical protein